MAVAQPSPGDIVVDSHHHFWDITRLDYSWMPPGESIVRRNYLPADLRPHLQASGVSGTVLVQAQSDVFLDGRGEEERVLGHHAD